MVCSDATVVKLYKTTSCLVDGLLLGRDVGVKLQHSLLTAGWWTAIYSRTFLVNTKMSAPKMQLVVKLYKKWDVLCSLRMSSLQNHDANYSCKLTNCSLLVDGLLRRNCVVKLYSKVASAVARSSTQVVMVMLPNYSFIVLLCGCKAHNTVASEQPIYQTTAEKLTHSCVGADIYQTL